MPHCVVEFSANLDQIILSNDYWMQLHKVLSNGGHLALSNIKSRGICHSNFHIADGSPEKAFVHTKLSILNGRSAEVRKELGRALLEFQKQHWVHPTLSINLTVQVEEIDSEFYFR